METNEVSGLNKQVYLEVFKIKKAVYQEMIKLCQNCLPYEACGLLSGTQGIGMRLWEIKNEFLSPNRFYMPKESIKQAIEEMELREEQLTGIFHSHPRSPAFPSISDIKNNPYFSIAYLIVSFYKDGLEVGCFKTDGQKAIPLKLVTID
ncbi:M67 family metallopeptidase [Neobacillus mesonae]|uniref:M67 family metallopeptidase n=1 Tax=Neobacillus mesonae TaxID=1193713 RepID=UPI002E21A371|nr:M67 family metallopeptidase [Neobacillus mesonae]